MKVTTIGLDIAKQVFQVHGVDQQGKVVLRRRLRREQVARFFANLTPCVVGLEACGGAHYWVRRLSVFGHTVRLMAPQFVKPYVKSNKNDNNDAEAICEAVTRPHMRFVAAKSVEQQDIQSLHRVRS
jgi:transposase